MRTVLLLGLALVCVHAAAAAVTSQSIGIDLSPRGDAYETVTLRFSTAEQLDSLTYVASVEPVAVVFDGASSVQATPEGWLVTLERPFAPGEHEVSFSLLFEDAFEERGADYVYAIAFEPVAQSLDVTILLPDGFVLAATEPAVIPAPDEIATDGRGISLSWRERSEAFGVIVLFEDTASVPLVVLLALASLVLAAVIVFAYKSRRLVAVHASALHESLSAAEQELIAHVRAGTRSQKELGRLTGWSKAKMSKVVRKLEEKRIVAKEPHFKTNRLALLPPWDR